MMINLTIEGLVSSVIYLIVLGAICWLLIWLISYCNPPEPINKIARMIVVVVSVLLVICLLLGFAGHPVFLFH